MSKTHQFITVRTTLILFCGPLSLYPTIRCSHLTIQWIQSILIAFGSKNPIQPQRNRCKYKASREDKSSPSNDDRYPITQHTHWGSWTQNTHHTVSMSDVKRTTANSILNPCARPMDECGAPYEAAGALCIVECFRCMMFSLMLATQWFSLMRFACVGAAALRRHSMVAVGWRNVVQCIRIALNGVHVLGFCFRFIFFFAICSCKDVVRMILKLYFSQHAINGWTIYLPVTQTVTEIVQWTNWNSLEFQHHSCHSHGSRYW